MAVVLIVLIGAYAYVASQPTAEQILKEQAKKELETRQKEFQKTLTYVQHQDPKIFGFPNVYGPYNRVVIKECYETLVRYEGDSLDPKPCLAEKWEMSPDGKVYTFYLRKGVKFYPSGDPLNAEAVKTSIDFLFLGKETAIVNYGGPDWVQYDRCEIVDDHTIRIYMKKPIAWFMGIIASQLTGTIWNPKFVNAHGGPPKNARTAEGLDPYLIWHQDVTGPYIVDEFKPGDRVILKRNPTYWMGWTGEMAKRPERVVIRLVPETATRMLLMARGDADIAFVDVAYLPELKRRIVSENLPLSIDESPTLVQYKVLFDHLNPPTSDVHIRRALAWSFNYDEYIEKILYGLADRQISFVPKGMWGYQPDVPHYKFDLEKAKQELALAKPENREMVQKGIKVTYAPGIAIGKEGYLLWKSDLAKIGVNLILNEVSSATYRDMGRVGGSPLYDRRWLPDFLDPATFYMFLNPSFWLASAWGTSPPLVGELLERAAFEVDQDKRLKIYRQVEEWAFESVPFIKVAALKGGRDYNVLGSWVKGYKPHSSPDQKPTFWELWKELPETGKASASALFLMMPRRNEE